MPEGAATGLAQIARYLADEHSGLPVLLRPSMRLVLEEIRLMEARIGELERQLSQLAKASPACQVLQSVPGIGLLTSTAMVAAVADPGSFASGRRYSSFLGLTPREYFLRQLPLPGTHLQARRSLHPHAPDSRSALDPARGHRGAARWATNRPAQELGPGRTGTHQSQQGRLRPGQQARAHRLGSVGEA